MDTGPKDGNKKCVYFIYLIDFYFLCYYLVNLILSFVQKLDREFDEVWFGLEETFKILVGKCNHCNGVGSITNVTQLKCNKRNHKSQPKYYLKCAHKKTNK